MKLSSAMFAAASAVGLWTSPAAAEESADVSDFLHAIRQVESGDRYDAPTGPCGEVGPYQFRRQVWHRYTRAPLAAARTRLADLIAARHYAWIKRQIELSGQNATCWRIAAAWNGGVGAVCAGRIPAAARDYAGRVQNLVEDQTRRPALPPMIFRISLAASDQAQP